MAFLLVAPIVGSALASFGLWIALLVTRPPTAILTTIQLGIPSALASLIVARCVRPERIGSALIIGVTGALSMVLTIALVAWLLQPDYIQSNPWLGAFGWFGGWFATVGFLCAQIAYGIATWIKRPHRVLTIILGLLLAWCLVWFLILQSKT